MQEEKAANTEKANALDSSSGEVGIAANHVEIDPALERRVIRKFDLLVMPQMILLVILAYLDRSNIGNARVFGFEEGLGLHGTQFNDISMVFYVTYVVFEIPWTMAIKKFGANRVMAVAMITWSATTIGTGFIHNYGQAIALRLLLGFFEAGLFPCLTLVVSLIYTREQQAKRVSMLYAGIAISGAFGGLIAFGIQTMGDRLGLAAWRWLFIVEGIISIVLGCICWVSLPKDAENAWFLKPHEKALMRARKERDAVYKGDDKFSWHYVKLAFMDPFVYVAAAGLFLASIPLFGFATFLPTIIKGFGYNSLQANYLTIPVYIFGTISLYCSAWVSDRLNKRAVVAGTIPFLVVIGYAIAVGTPNLAAGFFGMFLCAAGIYPYNTIVLTWVSNNLKPDHKRAVGIPLFLSLANIGGILASQIYPARDSPRYVPGNATSLGMEAGAILCVWVVYFLMRWRNKKKQKLIDEGVTDNGKEGDEALDFKYTL